jgi:hypothetical protein
MYFKVKNILKINYYHNTIQTKKGQCENDDFIPLL